MAPISRKYTFALFWVVTVLILFYGNHLVSLWDQDEAAYAGFALNMLESENWLVPEFMWSDVHRKTPLHFWNIAMSYQIFGINEFSVRFPSALMILLTYICIYIGGKPIFGDKVSFRGVVVLSSSFFITSLAKISVTDATVLFFSTLCALATLYVLLYRSWWAVLVYWGGFALGILAKGPPIVVFSGIFIVLLFITHPQRKNLFLLHPWFFLPVALVPFVLWTWHTSQIEGGAAFLKWMLDWYILKRIGDSVFGQTGPPGTHLVGLALFFLPYFMFFPKAFGKAIGSIFKDKGQDLLLGAWFVASWFIYELSPSKLPAYVVTAHIPLALLIARLMSLHESENTRPSKVWVIIQFVLLFVIYSALLAVPHILMLPLHTKWIFSIFSILLMAALGITLLIYRSNYFFRALLLLNVSFQVVAWVFLLPLIDSFKNSSKRVGTYAAENAKKSSTVLIANDHGHPPSLPFYLSLHFTQVQEEYNFDVLMQKYESGQPHVLILNDALKDQALAQKPKLKFATVSSILIDRNQQAHYHILINDAAKSTMVSSLE